MITRVRLSPPRIDQALKWIVDGRTLRRPRDVMLITGEPLWFKVNTHTYLADDALYFTRYEELDLRSLIFLARFSDQMNTVILTPKLCAGVRRRVCEFL